MGLHIGPIILDLVPQHLDPGPNSIFYLQWLRLNRYTAADILNIHLLVYHTQRQRRIHLPSESPSVGNILSTNPTSTA